MQSILKVLKHYEREGKVHVTPLTLPGGMPNIAGFQHMYLSKKTSQKRQNELIPYNDCKRLNSFLLTLRLTKRFAGFYKNMYKYEFIALLDIGKSIKFTHEQLCRTIFFHR